MTTRRWFYLIPAERRAAGLVHAIERHNLAHLPGDDDRYAGRVELEAGLKALLAGCARVAMEYSPRCAIPYVSRVDAGTIELVREPGVDGRVVGRSDPAVRGALDRPRLRDAPRRRPSGSTASRIGRSRRSRGACATASPTTEYDIQQQMVRLVRRRGPGHRLGADRRGRRRTPATRTTCRSADAHRGRSAPTNSCCSTSGASWPRPARSSPTSRGWASPGRTCPAASTAAFAAIARRARRGRRAGAGRGRAPGREVRGFEADRAARQVLQQAGLRRRHPAPHRPQPRRRGARQRRAPRRLRDARRAAAAARHGVHHRTGAVFRGLSAFGPRSTWSGRAGRPRSDRARARRAIVRCVVTSACNAG